jgi:geranylgeranyl diphosphate synthase type II
MNVESIFQKICAGRKPPELYQPIEYILMQGGKRIRPQLLMMSTRLFGGNEQQAFLVAAAFEMLHNFTLIHDDIMDKADVRRGKPTVYRKWNSNIAILSGDALANMALREILKTDFKPEIKLQLINLFSQTSLEVCEGQQLDLNFETQKDVDIEDYMNMIRLKTAVMLAACLKAGAILSEANEEKQQHIYDFGIALGIAFQLKDDYLDLYADHSLFGKSKGIDIQDNKKTYLYLRALQDGDEKQRQCLRSLFSGSESFETKLLKIGHIYEALSIQEKTINLTDEYLQIALLELDKINIDSDAKYELKELAFKLSRREK